MVAIHFLYNTYGRQYSRFFAGSIVDRSSEDLSPLWTTSRLLRTPVLFGDRPATERNTCSVAASAKQQRARWTRISLRCCCCSCCQRQQQLTVVVWSASFFRLSVVVAATASERCIYHARPCSSVAPILCTIPCFWLCAMSLRIIIIIVVVVVVVVVLHDGSVKNILLRVRDRLWSCHPRDIFCIHDCCSQEKWIAEIWQLFFHRRISTNLDAAAFINSYWWWSLPIQRSIHHRQQYITHSLLSG